MKQDNKEKKIVFSEKIDSTISGLALVLTFILIGVFLLFNSQYFGNEITAKVIQWIFIVVGTLGFGSEISKIKKDKEKRIKGIDDIITGIVVILIWFLVYKIVNNTTGNSIAFLLLILGTFGTFKGIIEVIYSAMQLKKEKSNKKVNTEIMKDVMLMLSQIAGICLIAVQILQALGVIKQI